MTNRLSVIKMLNKLLVKRLLVIYDRAIVSEMNVGQLVIGLVTESFSVK